MGGGVRPTSFVHYFVIVSYAWTFCGLYGQDTETGETPTIIIAFSAEYQTDDGGPVGDQCSSLYGDRMMTSIERVEHLVVRQCPQNVGVEADQNPTVSITGNKVSFTVTFNITSASDKDPTSSRPHLRECLKALKTTFQKISTPGSHLNSNLNTLGGGEGCEEISLLPTSLQFSKEIFIPEEPSSDPATSGLGAKVTYGGHLWLLPTIAILLHLPTLIM